MKQDITVPVKITYEPAKPEILFEIWSELQHHNRLLERVSKAIENVAQQIREK